MSKTKKPKAEYYQLVTKGFVCHLPVTIGGSPATIWPLAKTHEDATKLVEWLKNTGQMKHFVVAAKGVEEPVTHISPALIGSILGEYNTYVSDRAD